MPAPMITSVVVTCAARVTTYTRDLNANWGAYEDDFTAPLYLPSAGEWLAVEGCDPVLISIEPSAEAIAGGWAFQIPGETAAHSWGVRRAGSRRQTFEFAVSAPTADVEKGTKTFTVQRYQERALPRAAAQGARDRHRYRPSSPYRAGEVRSDPVTVLTMQIKRQLGAYEMRRGSGMSPGSSSRRHSTWSLTERATPTTGVVTSTSLTGVASPLCNSAGGPDGEHVDCARVMEPTQTPHPTANTLRTNDDLHGAADKSAVGGTLRSPYGAVLLPNAGAGKSEASVRRTTISTQRDVGITPARHLLQQKPIFASGSTATLGTQKALRILSANETEAVQAAFGEFDLNHDNYIDGVELTCVATAPLCKPDCSASCFAGTGSSQGPSYAASTILNSLGIELRGSPQQISHVLAEFDLQAARHQERIERMTDWFPGVASSPSPTPASSTMFPNSSSALPGNTTIPTVPSNASVEPAPTERPLISITVKEFTHWIVGVLDKHIPGWTPPAPPLPIDHSEKPWGVDGLTNNYYDGVTSKIFATAHYSRPMDNTLLPTHFREQERRLTYGQAATPFDDTAPTRHVWWHPQGTPSTNDKSRRSNGGEDFEQPLPRPGVVDTVAELDNRHRGVAPPFATDMTVLPSYDTVPRRFEKLRADDGSVANFVDDPARPILTDTPHP